VTLAFKGNEQAGAGNRRVIIRPNAKNRAALMNAAAPEVNEGMAEDYKVMEIMKLLKNNNKVEESTIRAILGANQPKNLEGNINAATQPENKAMQDRSAENAGMHEEGEYATPKEDPVGNYLVETYATPKEDPVGKYLVETYRETKLMEKKRKEMIHFKEIPKDGVQPNHVASLLGPEFATKSTVVKERTEKIQKMKSTLRGWALGIVSNIE
jgi:ABC-type molybdate transport system substrate-binding protein